MGIKYQILEELKNAPGGLTTRELSEILNKKDQIIRTIINRDLKGKLIKELGIKRKGNKVYVLINGDNESEDFKLLKGLNTIMLTKMQPKARLEPEEREMIRKILERLK